MRHIRREALPWQAPLDRTECGREITGRMPVMSRREWSDIARDLAEERAAWKRLGSGTPLNRKAPNVCATCVTTCRLHPSWDHDPLAVLHRVFEINGPLRTMDGVRVRAELKALADLATLVNSTRFVELAAQHEEEYRWRARSRQAGRADRQATPVDPGVIVAALKTLM